MAVRAVNDREEASAKQHDGLFDWLYLALCAWMVAGAYLDGWAHSHLSQLETFFTPWHAVLYSGFTAQAAFLAGAAFLRHRRGIPWPDSLPSAYRLSLLGSLIFLIGGAADMFWHLVFGIEADVDALLSPTHLILAVGAALIVTGPVRAGNSMSGEGTTPARTAKTGKWPAVIALALLLNVFTFFTQYAHPWVQQLPSLRYWTDVEDVVFYRQALGVASILLQSAILVGILLYGQRHRSLPFGAITVIVGVNAISMALMRDLFSVVPAALAAAFIVDSGLLLLDIKAPSRTRTLLGVAIGLPLLVYAGYFLTLLLEGGLWWSVHLVSGSIALAGMSGFLLTLVAAGRAAEDPPPVGRRSIRTISSEHNRS